MANYYAGNFNIVPDLSKVVLSNDEKKGNFELVSIKKSDVIAVLEDSLDKATRKGSTLDILEVLRVYLNK